MTPPQSMKASMREVVGDASTSSDAVETTERTTKEKATKSPTAGIPTETKQPQSLPGVYDPDTLSCPLGQQYLPAVATICVTSFLYNAGQSTFDSFFPLLLSKKLAMAPTQIGALLTALSAVSFTVSATLFAPTQKFFGLTKTTVIGLTLVAIGLVCIGQAHPAAVPPAAFLYVSGLPSSRPPSPSSSCNACHRRDEAPSWASIPPSTPSLASSHPSCSVACSPKIPRSPCVAGRRLRRAAVVVARRAIVLSARAFGSSR